ncbi:MAG: HAD-IC family P-type ATPase [Lachnospiraceae bacterium]|nr:HAD-IC family P-type ATPase [Lachnospiraceae bacterium]
MKASFNVTGMSCANCVSNVERAVGKINGVEEVSVNLIEELMMVSYDESLTGESEIMEAVKKAGYGAESCSRPQNRPGTAAGSSEMSSEKSLKKDKDYKGIGLLISVILMVILMVIAMGEKHSLSMNALTQLLLVIPVMFINKRFYINAFKALRSGGTNMDVLVSLSSLCAFVYSLYGLYMILACTERGDMESAMQYAHNLFFDSAGMILTLVSVGKFLEDRSKKKTKDAIDSLIDICPKKITRIITDRDGNETEETVAAEDIRQGDIILISKGEASAVDGIVVKGSAKFDESAITGESEAIDKAEGDEVISATMAIDGYVRVRAQAVGEDSTLMKIVRMTKEAGASKAPIAKLADRISAVFVPTIVVISIVTFAIWFFVTRDFATAFSFGICVLVISCPCALGLATPVAITVGMGVGAKNGILFKTAESLQMLSSIDTAVFDKTGTITNGTVSVEGEVRKDTVRKTSARAMAILKKLGIGTVMLTGDKKEKALVIAKEAGVSDVRYELKPEDKAGSVKEFQEKGKKVLAVGDGINDAPALAAAEVGMAMGAGKDIAIECADVVLMHSDLLDVVRAIRLSKGTLRNIKENLFWAFFYNVVMIPVAAGAAYPLFGLKFSPMMGAACMSLSSICVCLNAVRLMGIRLDKDIAAGGRTDDFSSAGNKTDSMLSSDEDTVCGVNSSSKECEEVGKCNCNIAKGETEMIKFGVDGMMCAHCKGRVEDALKAIDGVTGAVADLDGKCVTIEAGEGVTEEMCKEAVTAAGYKVQ